MDVKQSFIQMPEVVLKKKLSLRAVYMYAKMLMLNGKVYNRESWVTNPVTQKKKMSVDALSDIVKQLTDAGLIRVVPVETKKSRYKTNRYEIVPQPGYYKPVCHDFINEFLSAEAKGLGILMCLLKEIPSSDSGIAKAIRVSTVTVKKYIYELEHGWIYYRDEKRLTEDYFPFYKQIREKRERRAQKLLEDFKLWMTVFEDDNNQPTPYYKRTMEWLKRKNIPEEIKAIIWRNVLAGTWKLTKERQAATDILPLAAIQI